jgi:hypothetical protein
MNKLEYSRQPELEPGEWMALRGGFGGHIKWLSCGLWSFFTLVCVVASVVGLFLGWFTGRPGQLWGMIVFGLFCLLMALIPYLQSGRYLITNRRVFYWPTVGRSVFMRISQIERVDYKNSTSTLHLHLSTKQVIRIRYVSSARQLWGALLFYSLPYMDQPVPPLGDPATMIAHRGYWQEGMRMQNGTMVITPQSVCFFPDVPKPVHLGKELLKHLALGVVHAHHVRITPMLPVIDYLSRLAQGGTDWFEARLIELAELMGGERFAPDQAQRTKRRWRFFKLELLEFGVDKKKLFAWLPGAQIKEAQSWLAVWGA